jgi:hypothetical protein
MRAVGTKCFIEPAWDVEEKSGEIFLPAVRHRDLPRTGIVKSVPRGAVCEFKEGDKVVYDFHKQQLINVPGHPITLAQVAIKDVLAVII